MHTKHSHLLKIRTAVALCSALLLCACSYDRITGGDSGSGGEEGEFTTVTLKVGAALREQNLATKGLIDVQENVIHNLYILAFQPDETGTYKLKYYVTGTPVTGGNGQFSFSLRRSLSGQADTKLLLIANQNPYPQINTGMTYEEVQVALTSVTLAAAPAFADTGIPMFGFAGDSPNMALEITDNMTPPLSANLLRTVARVDVGVGTYNETTGVWNKGNVDFSLTEINVFKPQNKYTLLPLLNNLEYDLSGIPSVTKPSPAGDLASSNFSYTGGAITNNTYCKAEIYIPEVLLKPGEVYDGNHDKRMALVIGGTYNGRTNYYRIDFTTARTNLGGTELHDVLRNHIYRYSITSVTQPGYTTPEAAYSGQPVGLSFTASITDWTDGVSGSPNPDMLVRMNLGEINGAIIKGFMIEGSGSSQEYTVKVKASEFISDAGVKKAMLHYNSLRGEATDNTYNGSGNGGLYTNVGDALKREGPYAKLVIAPDNTGDAVVWKTGTPQGNRVLVAKKACWDYRGQGRSDWRLPRLSELCLLWLNKETINESKGFTSLGSTTQAYWTASEGGNEDKAYTINAAGVISLQSKTEQFLVRCVREVK